MEYKVCSKCNSKLPATTEYFRKHSGCKDGLRPDCKKCAKKRDSNYYQNNKQRWSDYYEENKESIREKDKKWRENNKEKIITYNKKHYWENREENLLRKKMWHCRNQEHVKSYRKKYRVQNRERLLEKSKIDNQKPSIILSQKRWRERNKERVYFWNKRRKNLKRSMGGDIKWEDWEQCLKFFDNKDAYTGKEMNVVTQDHVVPVSKGGKNIKNNIVPCDSAINSRKNNKDMIEWFREQPFFSEERLNKIQKWMNLNT